MRRLANKIVIVTGAGSAGPGWGNGKAAAVLFAREGAAVLAVDVNPMAAQETCALIVAEGGRCVWHAADVSKAADVAGAVERCVAEFGRVDVLHHNVGIVRTGGPVELSEEDWDRTQAVNMKSFFLTCKHVLPHMEAQGAGAIVAVSSVGGIRWTGIPYIAYAASKAAVLQMTQSVALQYARKGIRCNAVVPGLIDTPLVRASLSSAYDGAEMDEIVRRRHEQAPMGRMGDAWDVAHAALFLASDDARYITGTSIVVDGGLSAAAVG
ncbi:MAG: SDR family NAD(P)-dependent oxidoreductase [Chloroflexi bacterium]|nr:SDR family NAD(P)-dependent oxidoreductase [Chloroflexota bacterium]